MSIVDNEVREEGYLPPFHRGPHLTFSECEGCPQHGGLFGA